MPVEFLPLVPGGVCLWSWGVSAFGPGGCLPLVPGGCLPLVPGRGGVCLGPEGCLPLVRVGGVCFWSWGVSAINPGVSAFGPRGIS